MNNVSGEDLACTDEIKVYEDEGEEDEQVKSSENLTEDKVGLVIESEGQVWLFYISWIVSCFKIMTWFIHFFLFLKPQLSILDFYYF